MIYYPTEGPPNSLPPPRGVISRSTSASVNLLMQVTVLSLMRKNETQNLCIAT